MNKRTFGKIGTAALLACALPMQAMAQDVPVVIGKNNDWLFTVYEFALTSDAADTKASIDALIAANRLFQAKGIAVVIAITPSKVRIHQDQLPASKPLDAYTDGKYDNIVKALNAGGVAVADVNKAFMASPHRTSDTPLFLRLDTHWSQTGSFTAGEAIKGAVLGNPRLKAALDATPEVKFTMEWNANKANQRARDLVRLLPPTAGPYPPEQARNFKVTRETAAQASLTGAGENVGVLTIGSSFTNRNTNFPDSVRFNLQRELLDISLPVDQGPWFGMLSYLGDEAYKTRPPKLIVWEIPEREFRSPPNNKSRDPRFQFDNADWLAKMTAALK